MSWVGTKVFDYNSKYNYSDLNNVNTNIAYLLDTIKSFGYDHILEYPVKVHYTRGDFPNVSDINNVKGNLLYFISMYPVNAPPLTINANRLQVFDYIKANELEANLLALYEMINRVIDDFEYCGAITCGQEFNLGGV